MRLPGILTAAFALILGVSACTATGPEASSTRYQERNESAAPGFSTTIEVVVPVGTNALAFVPNANRNNFADGRPAIGIALLTPGEPLPGEPGYVIQRVTLDIPPGTSEAVLCTGTKPGEGNHAYFSAGRVERWRTGAPKQGLVGLVSTPERQRLGPKIGPIERSRGYPKHI